jgi:hypothetical protein
MTVTGPQILGMIMGSIPGLNIIASVIKFVYYNRQESELKDLAFARAPLEQTAIKVDEVAQNTIPSMDGDIERLKWYAILQIIPLIGIYFVWAEKKLLERINSVTETNFPVDNHEIDSQVEEVQVEEVQVEEESDGSVIEVTEANFQEVIKKGKVALLFYSSLQPTIKQEFDKGAKIMKSATFASFNIDDEKVPASVAIDRGCANLLTYDEGKHKGSIMSSIDDISKSYLILATIRQSLHVY